MYCRGSFFIRRCNMLEKWFASFDVRVRCFKRASSFVLDDARCNNSTKPVSHDNPNAYASRCATDNSGSGASALCKRNVDCTSVLWTVHPVMQSVVVSNSCFSSWFVVVHNRYLDENKDCLPWSIKLGRPKRRWVVGCPLAQHVYRILLQAVVLCLL